MTNFQKGRFLESIIHRMYLPEGDIVEKNVFLKPLYSSGRRKKREIDILITKKIAGIKIRIVIECKNESKPIGVPKIDAFIGKLIDIGIPSSTCIYVSSCGYTKGAVERAKQAGILLLDYKLINRENTKQLKKPGKISVFTMLVVNKIILTNNYNKPGIENIVFFDADGKVVGTVFDLLYNEWISNNITDRLGAFDLQINVPEGWFQINSENRLERTEVSIVEASKIGLLLVNEGIKNIHGLTRHDSDSVEHLLFDYEFSEMKDGEYSLKIVTEENEITKIVTKYDDAITFRVKIPRINNGSIYWPPSDFTFQTLAEYHEKHKLKARISDVITKMEIVDIEGRSINTAFLPPSNNYLERIEEIFIRKRNS